MTTVVDVPVSIVVEIVTVVDGGFADVPVTTDSCVVDVIVLPIVVEWCGVVTLVTVGPVVSTGVLCPGVVLLVVVV